MNITFSRTSFSSLLHLKKIHFILTFVLFGSATSVHAQSESTEQASGLSSPFVGISSTPSDSATGGDTDKPSTQSEATNQPTQGSATGNAQNPQQEDLALLAQLEGKAPKPKEKNWQGATFEFGYSYSKLTSGKIDEEKIRGTVHGIEIGAYVRDIGPVRFGGYTHVGLRSREGKDDFVFRGALSLGYRHIWHLQPVVPFINVTGTYGFLFAQEKRRINLSEDPNSDNFVNVNIPKIKSLWGYGPEVGVDVKLAGRFGLGLSFHYLKINMEKQDREQYLMRARLVF